MRGIVALFLALAPLAALAQMPSAGLLDSAPVLPDIRAHGDWRVSCAGDACVAEPARQVAPLSISIARDPSGEVLVLRAPLASCSERVWPSPSTDARSVGWPS